MAKLVNATDLKSVAVRLPGSSPGEGTKIMLVQYDVRIDAFVKVDKIQYTNFGKKFGAEISEKAWNKLNVNGSIPCKIGLTEHKELEELAKEIENASS